MAVHSDSRIKYHHRSTNGRVPGPYFWSQTVLSYLEICSNELAYV